MKKRAIPAALLTLIVVAGGTAGAQRVTLTVHEATLAEVAAQLRAQSGYEIQYVEPPEGAPGPRRRSFTWAEVPLKEALRQVGAAYGYIFQRNSPMSFWGQPGRELAAGRRPGVTIPTAAPAGAEGKAHNPPLQLYVDRLAISEMRVLEFGNGQAGGAPAHAANQSFSIELVAEGDTEEAVDAIYGFDTGVEAMDDLGNRLVSEVRSFNTGPGSRYPNPDQWRQYLTLPAPGARAKKLVYLTGELVLYREVKPARLEIPLPLPQRPFTCETGGVQVTVRDAVSQGADFVVRAAVIWPGTAAGAAGRGGAEEQRQIRPLLVTASGRRLRTNNVTAEPTQGAGGASGSEQQLRFAAVNEPVVKLIYDVTVKTHPDRRVRYRITDIPLPPPAASFPAKAPRTPQPAGRRVAAGPEVRRMEDAGPQAVEVAEDATNIPFYEAGGGTLVLRLKGAPEAPRLALGLSRREGGEWSGWRWADMARAPDGSARLGPLRPGAYRVRYTLSRPNGAASGLTGDRRPIEMPVQIVAGRDVTVR